MNILERVGHAIFVVMTQLCHGTKATQPIGEQLSVVMFQRIHGAGTGRMWPVAHITPTPRSDQCIEKESGDPAWTGVLPRGRSGRKPSEVIGSPQARKERNLLCSGEVTTKSLVLEFEENPEIQIGKGSPIFYFYS